MVILRCFQWSRTDYLIHSQELMSQADISKFDLALHRMLKGEPIQYIVGFNHFMDISLKLMPTVLSTSGN